MNLSELAEKCRRFSKPYRVTDGDSFRLNDIDPGDTGGFDSDDRDDAKEALAIGVEALAEYQERLYADDCHGVLLIFQAMDAAGKDSAIKNVMSGVNPTGCQVYSFKAPSEEERDHDFLWRCVKRLPERGRIGIFNRSYYEEVLVVRVHSELLKKQKLPPDLVTKEIWEERFTDISNFERYLSRNGYLIRKFFLHVSKKEQKKRFLERLERPEKNWKFSEADVKERKHWKEYMDAYEEMIQHTATKFSPWYVVPADNKWYTRLVVAAAIVDALASLELEFPKVTEERQKALAHAKEMLEQE